MFIPLVLWQYLDQEEKRQSSFLTQIDLYKRSDIAVVVPDSIRYILEPDYNNILLDWISTHLGINLNIENTNVFSETVLYDQLLKEHNVTIDLIEDDSILSLLYFKGNDAEIEEYLRSLHQSNQSANNDEYNEIDVETIEVINAELNKNDNSNSNGSGKKKKTKKRRVHSKKSDEFKIIKGKQSELLVLKKFQEIYGKSRDIVRWVSGYSDTIDRDDNLQHDIEYRNEEGIWIHVEVKTLTNNSFVLTTLEKEHALLEKEKYEFALVDGNIIYRVYQPFHFKNGDSFVSNNSFKAVPKDYTIQFNLSKLVK
jgi:hypothetical protein